MAVILEGTFPEETIDATAPVIEAKMNAAGIADVPPAPDIAQRLRDAVTRRGPTVSLRLAEGTPPSPPKHGEVSWARDFFGTDFVVDEKTGAVDWRQRTGNPSVAEGEEIATLTKPHAGEAGRDVFGKPIPAPRAKAARLRAGPNVRKEERDEITHFFATTHGRVRKGWDVIAVDPVLTIHGDVGLETGHIDHPGAVVIEGDVLTGSRVRAGGDIDVHGLIEFADIEAGGDLTVDSGITGAPGRRVRAAGKIRARFLQEADVEAGHDVQIASGIIHSRLKTRGALLIPDGRIIGSEIVALGGVVAGKVGSPGQVSTTVTAAVDPWLPAELAERQAKIDALNRKIEELSEVLEPYEPPDVLDLVDQDAAFNAWQRRLRALSADERRAIEKAITERAHLNEEIKKIRLEMDLLRTASEARAKRLILVRDTLFQETLLVIGDQKLLVATTLLGPLRAVPGHDAVELRGDEAPPAP